MEGLLAPEQVFHISCDLSNAAGEMRTLDDKPLAMKDKKVYKGVEVVLEPCDYVNTGFFQVKNGKWANGAVVLYRSSVPGQKARIITDNPWHAIHVKPGGLGYDEDGTAQIGGRFHTELIDVEFENSADRPQKKGALHVEVFPTADEKVLATVVVRDSKFFGAKNGSFMSTGASMFYAENSEFGRDRGNNSNQEHAIYFNGILVTHLKDVLVFGDRAKGSVGGHQLKDKSVLRILENVTLSNDGGVQHPSPMPLGDFTAWSWTWSDGLNLSRIEPIDERPPTLIDLRRRYYAHGERVSLPWLSAEGWEMPMAPGECHGDVADNVYLHVFRDTAVDSFKQEPFVVRDQGAWATTFEPKGAGVEPANSYEDVMAHPRRNRSLTVTYDTEGTVDEGASAEGYWYEKDNPLVYTCNDPADLAPAVAELANDRDKFIMHALRLLHEANDRKIPLGL